MQPKLIEQPQERRRHQRVSVSLAGRYMLEDRREYPCRTVDMSPGGVSLAAPVRGSLRERVVIYLDEIGRIEGSIVRFTEVGFALAMHLPAPKIEKLADQLTWLANRGSLGLPEDRRHERIVPNRRHSMLRLEDGREHMVKLIDISISGAGIATDISLPLGLPVQIGETPAQVVRLFEGGVAIEFATPLPIYVFDENIKL